MLLKLLLKIWPSLVPFGLYISWILIKRYILNKVTNKVIDAQYSEIKEGDNSEVKDDSKKDFSLKNPVFVATIYLSLVMVILSFLFFAMYGPR